jgi:class 3 adenylate cyclase/tetratricopeptide (TPR) repeat protein
VLTVPANRADLQIRLHPASHRVFTGARKWNEGSISVGIPRRESSRDLFYRRLALVRAPRSCTLNRVAEANLQQVALERFAKVVEFQRNHRIELLTLLFTDIVDSTKLKQTLGDRDGVAMIRRHHALLRDVLCQFSEGEEINVAGDCFFIVFTKPSDAVKFSLLVQARLRAFSAEVGRPLLDRIGIHVGEVWLDKEERTRKAGDLYGLQVDTCARVQSLGQGDQILLTRFPFDSARQALRGEELEQLESLSWLSHGPYLMKGMEEPLEICEVGEAGKAKLEQPPDSKKARRFFSADIEPVLGWRPAVDQAVPGTGWVLEKKIGQGGFGEVWLGRDKRLDLKHVFKFCFRADRVRSLKREVTLFRLLRERVGAHPNIVAIEHVCFDQAPFYIVMRHVEGENLVTWCEEKGGIEKVPLAICLEIVAQVADALQAAHDSGVIHRDVKPSNILVGGPGEIHVYLTDFGIGQVISEEMLNRFTRSGFTQTVGDDRSDSGTQLYMAPELFSGKPASIRSDIYALGVVLYQLLVGDFTRPVTTDWAKRITDPLLQEDLENCFAGDPQERFAGAGQLAEQLRRLEERRAAAEKQQALLKERERAAYRRGIIRTAALALVVIGVVSGLAIYAFSQRHQARRAAKEASAQRRAAQEQARIAENRRLAAQTSERNANDARDQADGLIDFMLHDLRDKLQSIGRLDVLDDVAQKAKEYLDRLPKELVTPSRLKQQAAMLGNLGDVRVAQGKLTEALEAYQEYLSIMKRLVEQDRSNSSWQQDLLASYDKAGGVLVDQGKLSEALEIYQQSLVTAKALAEQDQSNSGWQWGLSLCFQNVGDVLVARGELPEAMKAYQQSLQIRQTLVERDSTKSDRQRDLSVSYNKVGDVLVSQGQRQEGLEHFKKALKIRQALVEQDKTNSGRQRDLMVSYQHIGDALVPEGRLQEALGNYQQGLLIAKALAEKDRTNTGWQRDLTVFYDCIGEVLLARGKPDEALENYQMWMATAERLVEQDKTNSDWQQMLSYGYEKTGEVWEAKGKLEEALVDYRKEMAIAKRLTEEDETNSDWKWGLSFSYRKVGDVLAEQGDLGRALEEYRAEFTIIDKLARQDPTNAGWQTAAALNRYSISKVLIRLKDGDRDEAKRLVLEGLEIMARLERQSGLDEKARDTANKLKEIATELGF